MEAPGELGCLYSVLGVPKDACASDIKLAYRRLALQHHPDKAADKAAATAQFAQISRAYSTLSDDAKRRYYDETGTDEGVEMSVEDFLAQFSALMHECTGGLPIQELLAGMSDEDIAAMPPFPFPRELFPAGTFPQGLRFSEEGLQGVPPAVQELLASGDTAALQQLLTAGAANAAAASRTPGAGWFDWGLDDGDEAMQDLDPGLLLDELPAELLSCIEAGDAAGAAAFLQRMTHGSSAGTRQEQQMIVELTQQLAALGPLLAGTSIHTGDRSLDPGSSSSEQTPDGSDSDGDTDGFGILRPLADAHSNGSDQQGSSLKASNGSKAAAKAAGPAQQAGMRSVAAAAGAADGVSRMLSMRWVEAAKAGEEQQLRRLLAANPQLLHHQAGALRSSALHWLAAKGHTAALQALLQLGADPGLLNAVGSTPLHAACAGGHAECVLVLLATGRAMPGLCNEEGLTAAELAGQHGHAECQQLAATTAAAAAAAAATTAASVPAGAASAAEARNSPGTTSSTPTGTPDLTAAVAVDTYVEASSRPASCSTAVQQDSSGFATTTGSERALPASSNSTPTHVASSAYAQMSGPSSQSGIQSRAGPDELHVQAPPGGPTCSRPVTDAADMQAPATAQAPTEPACAAPVVQAAASKPAAQHAEAPPSSTLREAAVPIPPPEAAARNSTAEAAAGISREVGRAWLDAAKAGSLDVLQSHLQQTPSLLQYSGKGTSYGFVGSSALHWAAAKGHAACVHWLLEQGADALELRNSAGSTALHSAAASGQVDCARLLMLEGGADMLLLNELGDSARSEAQARGHIAVTTVMDACHAALTLLSTARESWTARTMLAFLRLVGSAAEAAQCLERKELQDAVDRALRRFDGAHKGAAVWAQRAVTGGGVS